jgi:uncharacterized protein (TIGR02145 family)
MSKIFNLFIFILLTSFYGTNNTTKDIDGNIYKTTKIGTQTWMCSNLKVSRFKNGDLIKEAKTKSDWARGIETKTPMWCYYDFDAKNGVKLGKLYNFWAIIDKRGLAPTGWIIPNFEQWKQLEYVVGNKYSGKKLKSTSFNGTDDYGFNISGTGGIDKDGFYPTGLENGFFATCTEDNRKPEDRVNNNRYYYIFIFSFNSDQITWGSDLLENGVAVRCLKD